MKKFIEFKNFQFYKYSFNSHCELKLIYKYPLSHGLN